MQDFPGQRSPPRSLPPRTAASTTLEELATRLAREIAAAEAAPTDSDSRAIVFHVGPLTLGLPLTAVREVVLPPEGVSRVPRAPEALLGIMNLRGRVVVVVDLVHALPVEVASQLVGTHGLGVPGEHLAEGRILLLERNSHEIGLLVRSVEGIAPVAELVNDNVHLLDPEKVGAAIDALVM